MDLTHARLRSVPPVLQQLKQVEVLSLRQNQVSDLSLLSDLTTLRELDLYDNEISSIHAMERLTSLTYVMGQGVSLKPRPSLK